MLFLRESTERRKEVIRQPWQGAPAYRLDLTTHARKTWNSQHMCQETRIVTTRLACRPVSSISFFVQTNGNMQSRSSFFWHRSTHQQTYHRLEQPVSNRIPCPAIPQKTFTSHSLLHYILFAVPTPGLQRICTSKVISRILSEPLRLDSRMIHIQSVMSFWPKTCRFSSPRRCQVMSPQHRQGTGTRSTTTAISIYW